MVDTGSYQVFTRDMQWKDPPEITVQKVDIHVAKQLTKRHYSTLRGSTEAMERDACSLQELLTHIEEHRSEGVITDINTNLGKNAEQLHSLARFISRHSN